MGKELVLAIYVPLEKLTYLLKCTVQGKWPKEEVLCIIECRHITDLIGVWASLEGDNIYILQKHPGLSMLVEEEKGQAVPSNGQDDEVLDANVATESLT